MLAQSNTIEDLQMNIKPIRNEKDYDEALDEISHIFSAEPGTEHYDHLDVLITLVVAYEAVHYPVPPPDPIAAIEYEAEKRGLTRKDLEKFIGPSGRVSEVLGGQRPLTMSMVRRLQTGLGISADLLVVPYPTAARKVGNTGKKTQRILLKQLQCPPVGEVQEAETRRKSSSKI
jgi:HTH-type transcriptional regulator / antitoxin HigA